MLAMINVNKKLLHLDFNANPCQFNQLSVVKLTTCCKFFSALFQFIWIRNVADLVFNELMNLAVIEANSYELKLLPTPLP
jgi:hypothetical protein